MLPFWIVMRFEFACLQGLLSAGIFLTRIATHECDIFINRAELHSCLDTPRSSGISVSEPLISCFEITLPCALLLRKCMVQDRRGFIQEERRTSQSAGHPILLFRSNRVDSIQGPCHIRRSSTCWSFARVGN